MRSLRFLTVLSGFLIVFGCSVEVAVSAPWTAAKAQYFLNALPADAGHRDQAVYAAAKAKLREKVEEAKQSPERADAILNDLFFGTIKGSPAEGFDPENNARAAAAMECYIEILNNAAAKTSQAKASQAKPQPPKSTPPPPRDHSADDHARVAVDEIVKDATSGDAIDTSKFFPGSSSTVTSSNTNTRTNTGTNTGTNTNTGTTTRSGTNTGANTNTDSSTITSSDTKTKTGTDTGTNTGTGTKTDTGTNTNTSGTLHTGTNTNSGVRSESRDNSTATDVTSSYKPATRAVAQDIVGKYKSIPGGITFEGASPDLSFVRSARYVAWANAFVLNGDVVYLNPVPANEFADIYRALAADDKLGVSMGSVAIIYGALPPQGEVAANLELADIFLGDIAFGNRQLTNGYVFAPGYQSGVATGASARAAVYFSFHDFRFSQGTAGQLSRTGVRLDMTLVPLTDKPGADGGHLPDFGRIDKGDVAAEHVANLKHLQSNIDYYARERILRTAIAYGEVGAFVRALKANGINLDLQGLAKETPSAQVSDKASLPSPSGDACGLAAEHWKSAESIGTRLAYEDHLTRFAACPFATLATARIAALDKRETPDNAGQPKKCAAGFATDSDGDCVRQSAGKKTTTRKSTPRAAAGSSGASRDNQSLDCTNPVGLLACVNRAVSRSTEGR